MSKETLTGKEGDDIQREKKKQKLLLTLSKVVTAAAESIKLPNNFATESTVKSKNSIKWVLAEECEGIKCGKRSQIR